MEALSSPNILGLVCIFTVRETIICVNVMMKSHLSLSYKQSKKCTCIGLSPPEAAVSSEEVSSSKQYINS